MTQFWIWAGSGKCLKKSKSEFYWYGADPGQIQFGPVWLHLGPIGVWAGFVQQLKIPNLSFIDPKQILFRSSLPKFGTTRDQSGPDLIFSVSPKYEIWSLGIQSRSWPDPLWTSLDLPGTNLDLSRICSAAQDFKFSFYRSKANHVQIRLGPVWNHIWQIWTDWNFLSSSKIWNLNFIHSKQILTRSKLDQFGSNWDQFGSEGDLFSSPKFPISVL